MVPGSLDLTNRIVIIKNPNDLTICHMSHKPSNQKRQSMRKETQANRKPNFTNSKIFIPPPLLLPQLTKSRELLVTMLKIQRETSTRPTWHTRVSLNFAYYDPLASHIDPDMFVPLHDQYTLTRLHPFSLMSPLISLLAQWNECN